MFTRFVIPCALAISAISALPAQACADTVAYSYDTLGRLVRVQYPNGHTVLYIYDSAGNRVKVVHTPAASPLSDSIKWVVFSTALR